MSGEVLREADRQSLAEAFHAWDHAAESADDCGLCAEFVDDFAPLMAEIISERVGAPAVDTETR